MPNDDQYGGGTCNSVITFPQHITLQHWSDLCPTVAGTLARSLAAGAVANPRSNQLDCLTRNTHFSCQAARSIGACHLESFAAAYQADAVSSVPLSHFTHAPRRAGRSELIQPHLNGTEMLAARPEASHPYITQRSPAYLTRYLYNRASSVCVKLACCSSVITARRNPSAQDPQLGLEHPWT